MQIHKDGFVGWRLLGRHFWLVQVKKIDYARSKKKSKKKSEVGDAHRHKPSTEASRIGSILLHHPSITHM